MIKKIIITIFFSIAFFSVTKNIKAESCPNGLDCKDKKCLTGYSTTAGVQQKVYSCQTLSETSANSAKTYTFVNPTDNLNIKLPGSFFSFSKETACPNNKNQMCIPWIGEYIAGMYNFGIAIIGIIAVVILMFAGMIRITSGGNSSRVTESNTWIFASVTGLFIALTSYAVLSLVNPYLVNVGSSSYIAIQMIKELPMDQLLSVTTNLTGPITGDITYNSNSWDELINKVATSKGVDPALIKAIMAAESSGKPNAISSAGAIGLMQLMPATARGLNVSDPTDPEQSLTGGAVLIKQLLKTYNGDLAKALAAYNWRPSELNKSIKANGGLVIEKLPAETQKYIRTVSVYYDKFKGTKWQ
jgi:hypothetical protein